MPSPHQDYEPIIDHRHRPWRDPLGPVVRLNRVEADKVYWLSPGRFAAGKITVLDCDPGLGKSTLLCELAVRVTRGQPLP